MTVKTAITATAAALAMSLSASVMADEVYSETPSGMLEVGLQAICDGDSERYLDMHLNPKGDILFDEEDFQADFAEAHATCQDGGGVASIELDDVNTPDDFAQQDKRIYLYRADITLNDGTRLRFVSRISWGAFRVDPEYAVEGTWRFSETVKFPIDA